MEVPRGTTKLQMRLETPARFSTQSMVMGSVAEEELVEKVLAQRLVAKNTVLMNLNNRKHFEKDSSGNYSLKDVQTA